MWTARLPIDPLLTACGDPNQLQLARITGVQPRQVIRWLQEGGITYQQADEVAIRIGSHPVLIWPSFHDDLAEMAEQHRVDHNIRVRRSAARRRAPVPGR